MGRFSEPLAVPVPWGALAQVRAGQHATTTWACGPGALTVRLVQRLGAAAVAAVDPSASFVEAVRGTLSLASTCVSESAERLPFPTTTPSTAPLAQLVVHFMADPVAGLAEMARVTPARRSWSRRASGTTRAGAGR